MNEKIAKALRKFAKIRTKDEDMHWRDMYRRLKKRVRKDEKLRS
jgi:hypothetical protein